MEDQAWEKFQAQMKHKHIQRKSKADAGTTGIIQQCSELTLQRLSSGKFSLR